MVMVTAQQTKTVGQVEAVAVVQVLMALLEPGLLRQFKVSMALVALVALVVAVAVVLVLLG